MQKLRIIRIVLCPLSVHIVFYVSTLCELYPVFQFGHINKAVIIHIDFIYYNPVKNFTK